MTVVKLPVAVIAAVSVIAVTPIAAMGNAEHALDSPHGAANTGADRTANHAADGARNPVSLMRPLLRTPHDALGLAWAGRRKQDEQRRRKQRERCAGRPQG